MIDFKDKVVLITGAGQPAGRACALAYGKLGAKLAICDDTDAQGRETLNLLESQGVECLYTRVDVSSEFAAIRFVRQTTERFGRLDIAVNASARALSGPVMSLASTDFAALVGTNLMGTYYCMKQQMAQMRATGGGAILNIVPITGSGTASAEGGISAVGNAGVVWLSRSAAKQGVGENIAVNAIAATGVAMPDGQFRRWLERRGLAPAQAEALAAELDGFDGISAAALYLTSDAERGVAGEVLEIGS